MGVTKIRMLRWMSGYTKNDKIWNGYIWEKVGITSIEKMITETKL